jgi:hypothetical protein
VLTVCCRQTRRRVHPPDPIPVVPVKVMAPQCRYTRRNRTSRSALPFALCLHTPLQGKTGPCPDRSTAAATQDITRRFHGENDSMRSSWFLVLLAVTGICGKGASAEPGGFRCWRWPWSLACYHSCPCCPDDYCSKPLPQGPCPVRCCGPDDYCPKPLPIVCPVKWCGTDDYCPKPCPIVGPCCYPPWYTCGPEATCGQAK